MHRRVIMLGVLGTFLAAGTAGLILVLRRDSISNPPKKPTQAPAQPSPSQALSTPAPAANPVCDSLSDLKAFDASYESPRGGRPSEVTESFVAAKYPESRLLNGEFILEKESPSEARVSVRIDETTKASATLSSQEPIGWVLKRFEVCEEALRKESSRFSPLSSTKGLIAVVFSVRESSIERSRLALVDPSGTVARDVALWKGLIHPVSWAPSGGKLLYLRHAGLSHDQYRVADFKTGSDRLLISTSSYGGSPQWLDDERFLIAEDDALRVIRLGEAPQTYKTVRDFGVDPAEESDAGQAISRCCGIAVSREGQVGVVVTGNVVFFKNDLDGQHEITRVPDGTRCMAPHFRPAGQRIGLTCVHVPPDYDPSSTDSRRNHYDHNAWVVDIPSRSWYKVRTYSGGHEWGAYFFPWTLDSRHYLVRSWSECSGSFSVDNATTGKSVADFEGGFGSFSPDGQWMVWSRDLGGGCGSIPGDPQLVISRLDGSGERLLAAAHMGLWSPIQ